MLVIEFKENQSHAHLHRIYVSFPITFNLLSNSPISVGPLQRKKLHAGKPATDYVNEEL